MQSSVACIRINASVVFLRRKNPMSCAEGSLRRFVFCKKPDAMCRRLFFGDDYLSVLFGSNIFDDALEA